MAAAGNIVTVSDGRNDRVTARFCAYYYVYSRPHGHSIFSCVKATFAPKMYRLACCRLYRNSPQYKTGDRLSTRQGTNFGERSIEYYVVQSVQYSTVQIVSTIYNIIQD